jgi:polysaccharide biosynthesis protein PslH
MRAHAVTQALAKSYRVCLSVPRPDGTVPPSTLVSGVTMLPRVRAGLQDRLQRWLYHHLMLLYQRFYTIPGDWERPGSTACRNLSKVAFNAKLSRVHVFRQYMTSFAGPFLGRIPCQLDLDESEARTRRSIAALARSNGDQQRARLLEMEAEFYADAEQEWLPRFDRVFVSSEAERRYLLDRYPRLTVHVLPNSIALPSFPPVHRGRFPLTLLCVGNLGYYPNADAIRYFLGEILPLVQAQMDTEVKVNIVGPGASIALQKTIRSELAARWLGFVSDLSSEYWSASLAIVPLRAGGGTRMKILEAFAHRLPVVSTSIGVEGLEARPEVHLLVGDTPESFAHCCVRLMQDEDLRRQVAAKAYELVASRYSAAPLSVPD